MEKTEKTRKPRNNSKHRREKVLRAKSVVKRAIEFQYGLPLGSIQNSAPPVIARANFIGKAAVARFDRAYNVAWKKRA